MTINSFTYRRDLSNVAIKLKLCQKKLIEQDLIKLARFIEGNCFYYRPLLVLKSCL
jgi:hypothetical protein